MSDTDGIGTTATAEAKPTVVDFSQFRDKIKPWVDEQIRRRRCTDAIGDEEREKVFKAIGDLYARADMFPPTNIVLAKGPTSGLIAAGIAAGAWYLRDNPDIYRGLFYKSFNEADLMAAVPAACKLAVEFTHSINSGVPVDGIGDVIGDVSVSLAAATEAALAAAADATPRAKRKAVLANAISAMVNSAVVDVTTAAQLSVTESVVGSIAMLAGDDKLDALSEQLERLEGDDQTAELAATIEALGQTIRRAAAKAIKEAEIDVAAFDRSAEMAEKATRPAVDVDGAAEDDDQDDGLVNSKSDVIINIVVSKVNSSGCDAALQYAVISDERDIISELCDDRALDAKACLETFTYENLCEEIGALDVPLTLSNSASYRSPSTDRLKTVSVEVNVRKSEYTTGLGPMVTAALPLK